METAKVRDSGVRHLQRCILSNLRSRGLSFCPTPHRINKEKILDDLESYFRHSRLKEYFLEEENEEDQNDAQISLRPPSTWMPPKGRDHALETYIKRTRKDVERQLKICRLKKLKTISHLKKEWPLDFSDNEQVLLQPDPIL